MDENETTEVKISDEPRGRIITVRLTHSSWKGHKELDTEYLEELIRDYDSINNAETQSGSSNNDNNNNAEEQRESESRSIFIWNEQCMQLLLALYEEHKEDFASKRHKVIYEQIANKMKDMNQNYDITGPQCQSKIISLKKTFKKIIDHNSTSGNDRSTWPHFDRMNEVFGTTGWAQPVAVASELGPEENTTPTTSPSTENQSKKRKFEIAFEEYRKDLIKHRQERNRIKEENFNKLLALKDQHHQEKMEILKQLLLNNRNN